MADPIWTFRSDTLGGAGDIGYQSGMRLAPAIAAKLRIDPTTQVPGMPPNYGEHVVPHVMTLQGLVTQISKAYRMDDEALQNSLENARFMELDVGLQECLQARSRSAALLNWHLEPEDPESTEQNAFCEHYTKLLQRIPRFMQYRECLLRAIWFGRYANSMVYGWEQVGGKMYLVVNKWRPVHGDKLVFRVDDGSPDVDPDQVGIRIGWTMGHRPGGYPDIEVTDRGRAYFLTPDERKLLIVHKHQLEDADFSDPRSAGRIHGVGIRSRIYWEWMQKQETLRWLMEYLERSAFGLDLWFYPYGNADARNEMVNAANSRISNFRNQIFIPVPADGSTNQYGVQHVETGMAGVEALMNMIERYFGHRAKRLILGQTLTSESEGGGLGSDGIARVHLGTFKDIVTYDAINLQETITTDLIEPGKNFNFRHARHFKVRFVIETEQVDQEERLKQIKEAVEMGVEIGQDFIRKMLKIPVPIPGEKILGQESTNGMPPGMPGQPGGHEDFTSAEMRKALAAPESNTPPPADAAQASNGEDWEPFNAQPATQMAM